MGAAWRRLLSVRSRRSDEAEAGDERRQQTQHEMERYQHTWSSGQPAFFVVVAGLIPYIHRLSTSDIFLVRTPCHSHAPWKLQLILRLFCRRASGVLASTPTAVRCNAKKPLAKQILDPRATDYRFLPINNLLFILKCRGYCVIGLKNRNPFITVRQGCHLSKISGGWACGRITFPHGVPKSTTQPLCDA